MTVRTTAVTALTGDIVTVSVYPSGSSDAAANGVATVTATTGTAQALAVRSLRRESSVSS